MSNNIATGLQAVLEQFAADGGATWQDKGLAAFGSATSKLDTTRIKLGVVGAEAQQPSVHDSRLTVGELALIHEHGTQTVPARPFINGVIPPRETLRILSAVAQAVTEGKDPEAAMKAAGEELVNRLRDHILAREELLPNASATVKRKGFNFPLLDTGQLLHSLGYELVYEDEGARE